MRLHVWLFVLILAGCVSSPVHELANLHGGMDKDEVLQTAGDPRWTFHTNGQDHWIYVYYQEGTEWRQQIDFTDGKVAKVGRAIDKANDINSAQTMEEFEHKVRAQQQKNNNFQNIDGQ